MRKSKKESKNWAVLICILALAGLILYKKQDDQKKSQVSEAPVSMAPDNVDKVPAPVEQSNFPESSSVSEGSQDSSVSIAPSHPEEDPFAIAQQKVIDQYSEVARVKIKLPTNLQYKEIDFDENVAVLYGQNPFTKKKLAILATKGKINVETAIKFVNDSQDYLPIVRGKGFKVSGALQTVTAPATSGLKPLKIIPGQTENGITTFAALAERADGKGTYLFMMQDQTQVFDGETEFDNFLNSVKAE